MVSDAQGGANAKYRKARMKQATVRFSPNEMSVYEFLCGHENASGYIKQLVCEDMGVLLPVREDDCPAPCYRYQQLR